MANGREQGTRIRTKAWSTRPCSQAKSSMVFLKILLQRSFQHKSCEKPNDKPTIWISLGIDFRIHNKWMHFLGGLLTLDLLHSSLKEE